jgi:bacteriorhodopsin
MNKVKIIVLVLIALIGVSSSANAEVNFLQPDDFVGFTFWLMSMAYLATTVFLFLERGSVASGWTASITVASIITGIAFVHFMYVRNIWVATGDSPIIYRYVDWLITMPLLIIQFYLVISAVKKIPPILFWKFLIAPLAMVCGSYAAEAGYIHSVLGLVIWMAGWIFILYELFPGEAGKIVNKSTNEDLVKAFGAMRMIVSIGWTVYPVGYVFGYLTGGLDSNTLNVIYNLADFINKIAFGLVIWVAARSQY